VQVNVSMGGVPKLPVPRAWVTFMGLEGDRHRESTVHGGPHRAVCLFPLEVIERLQVEGHPVEPGSVGENLTTSGLQWSLLPVGTRARIGSELEIELSSPTTPCATQKPNFRDGYVNRILIDEHPSDSRMYARVIREGEVRPGDPIVVTPPTPDSHALAQRLLMRLDRAELKSALAAWQAAADAGFDVRVVEDGEVAMAAAPEIPGPGFNHAVGFATMPQLIGMATDFYDRHQTAGWIISDSPPWSGAETRLTVGVFAAAPTDVPQTDAPSGVTLRRATADEGPAVEAVYEEAEATGVSERAAVNPWPQVYGRLATHAHRTILVAEMEGRIVGVASLHTHAKTGWLRGAAVLPHARGKGIQRALIAARAALAAELGCDLIGAWAEPDKQSSANLQRMGLGQIGTRDHFVYKPGSRAT
jgi:MOSC domain-containing protein YiiM/N-acetylglutamate synthase-like GNAT family acetyltransferase